MVGRALTTTGEWRNRALVTDANIYVSLWYIIVITGGLLPTLSIAFYTGQWCAPPFNYPSQAIDKKVIILHVIPATCWLFGSTAMLFATTFENFNLHREIGLCLMQTIFVAFLASAMYSLVSDLSPLGKHVQLMEWFLAFGTWLYFVLGMYFIAQPGTEYHTGHKICMVTTMITASGPGFFRVLRHFRELVTGRLFRPSLFTNYSEVPSNERNWTNLKSVESTYFCLAFIMTDAYLLFVFSRMGVLRDSEWSLLCWMVVSFPVISVLISALLRFVPGLNNDFSFSFALNYDFTTLMTQEKGIVSALLQEEKL
uniref:Uncharacterized protein n=1 Tax=Noctiluca scintillans TaxID=2966 RepID=A0A7S1F6Z8_NOCSC